MWWVYGVNLVRDLMGNIADSVKEGFWEFVMTVLCTFLLCIQVAVLAIPIKLAATVQTILIGPQLSLGRLPKNWWEQCLQKDLSVYPELLPGLERSCFSINGAGTKIGSFMWIFRELRNLDRDAATLLSGGIILLIMSPLLTAIILFGLGYRWCLKATSAFWVLLLFFSRPLRRRKDTLEWRVSDIVKHPWNKLTRLWGLAVIVMHGVVPLLMWQSYGALVARLHELEPQMQHLIRFFLAQHGWDQGFPLSAWHVAGALSALLTWGLWWMAHDKRIALEAGRLNPAEQEKGRRMIVGVMWVRSLLVSYTVFCGLVAIFKTLQWTMPNVIWLP